MSSSPGQRLLTQTLPLAQQILTLQGAGRKQQERLALFLPFSSSLLQASAVGARDGGWRDLFVVLTLKSVKTRQALVMGAWGGEMCTPTCTCSPSAREDAENQGYRLWLCRGLPCLVLIIPLKGFHDHLFIVFLWWLCAYLRVCPPTL